MTDWIGHTGGPQPVADDVWICIDAMPEEMEEVGAGYVRLPKQVGSWKHVTGFFVINQHLIDAARLEGIRLGLEAAMKIVWKDARWMGSDGPRIGEKLCLTLRNLNPVTIAREAIE